MRARPSEIVAARGLAIVSDDGALSAAVDNAIAANPDVADKIRDGKHAAAGALIGAVMKEMRGQADAGRVRELILEKLDPESSLSTRARRPRPSTWRRHPARARCSRTVRALATPDQGAGPGRSMASTLGR